MAKSCKYKSRDGISIWQWIRCPPAIFDAGNGNDRTKKGVTLSHPLAMFIKQATDSEPHGTQTAYYIVKLMLYHVFLLLSGFGNSTLILTH